MILPIRKALAILALLSAPLMAAPTLVTVTQTLFRADGTTAKGSVYVTWQSFTTAAGEQIPAGTKEVRLTSAGLLSVGLVPNLGSSPTGTRYLVTYRLDQGEPRNVSWIVPASGPVTVSAIESSTLTTPSSVISLTQLNAGGATNGQCMIYNGTLALWLPGPCSGSSTISFSNITTGANITATMTVGTGSSLVRTGTGIIDANKILGTTLTSLSGLIKMTSGVPSVAAAANVYALWSGTCNSSTFLRGDGSCVNPAGGVTSVFGRTGAVVAATNDYTAAQVTNAVDSTSTYSDPSWLTALLSTKLTFTALGDLVYGGAAGAGTRLAGNITTTKKFLRQTGDGAASAAPAWDTLILGDLPAIASSDLSDGSAIVKNNQTNTAGSSFTLDMNAAGTNAVRHPNVAGAAPTTAGAIAYDTTNKNLHAGANGVNTLFGLFLASALPTDGNCLRASVTAGVVRLADAGGVCTTGGGGGTVNTGTATHLAYYATSTDAVSDSGLVYTSVPTSISNDTNVTGSITTNVLTIAWSGTLAKARIISSAMYNDQANTGTSAFTLDMSASSSAAALRAPNIAGASSTTAGALSYDTTNKNVHFGANGVDNIVPALPSAGIPTTGDCASWAIASSVVTVTDAGFNCSNSKRRTACIVLGSNNASSTLADADLGPQSRQYFINAAATATEIEVAADGGTPNIIIGRSRAGSIVNLTSAALATASSGGIACSNTGGTTGIDGATTCSSTLQNTSLNAGDWITLVSGTAGGAAKQMTACVTFTVN